MLFHGLQTGEMNKRVVVIKRDFPFFFPFDENWNCTFEYIKEAATTTNILLGKWTSTSHHIAQFNITYPVLYVGNFVCKMFVVCEGREDMDWGKGLNAVM